jgi:hypothetical protein
MISHTNFARMEGVKLIRSLGKKAEAKAAARGCDRRPALAQELGMLQ